MRRFPGKYETTDITPDPYSAQLSQERTVIMANASRGNRQATHQLEPVEVDSAPQIVSVDEFEKYWIFGRQL